MKIELKSGRVLDPVGGSLTFDMNPDGNPDLLEGRGGVLVQCECPCDEGQDCEYPKCWGGGVDDVLTEEERYEIAQFMADQWVKTRLFRCGAHRG